MEQLVLVILGGLIIVSLTCRAGPATANMRDIVANNDVIYLSPAREGWEGLLLGNGRLGAQVWHPATGSAVPDLMPGGRELP